MDRYYIRGDNPNHAKDHNGDTYSTWSIFIERGELPKELNEAAVQRQADGMGPDTKPNEAMICSFFGGVSFITAALVCKAMNEGKMLEMSEALQYYEKCKQWAPDYDPRKDPASKKYVDPDD